MKEREGRGMKIIENKRKKGYQKSGIILETRSIPDNIDDITLKGINKDKGFVSPTCEK